MRYMDRDQEIDFKILKQFEKDPQVTQRRLAGNLGLSLRMTNTFIKRLCRKGYVKITTMPGHRFKYFLTPSGLTRKAKLSYEFVTYSLRFFKEARSACREVFAELAQEGISQVAFWGVSDLAEIAGLSLPEFDITLLGIYDNEKAGQEWMGIEILPESEAAESKAQRLIYTGQNWPGDAPYKNEIPVVHIFDHIKNSDDDDGLSNEE